MDISSTFSRNKIAVVLCALLVGVVLSVSGLFLIISSFGSSPSDKTANKKVETTTTEKSTTTSTTVESTTTISSSTTTTTAPKGVAAAATTSTTAAPVFSATPSATLSHETEDFCTGFDYTFTGTIVANIAGTATWEWIDSSGDDTGVSGTATFDTTGALTSSITPYEIHYPAGTTTINGWAALKVTFNGGSATSSHATYNYSVGPGSLSLNDLHATGC